jgi:hypothetical protein
VNTPQTFKIHFGVFAKSIRDQLREYGYNGKACPGLQAKADAITRLYVTSILTEGETKKARKRLYQEIKALVEPPREKKRGLVSAAKRRGEQREPLPNPSSSTLNPLEG